jgi:hypothetical protein
MPVLLQLEEAAARLRFGCNPVFIHLVPCIHCSHMLWLLPQRLCLLPAACRKCTLIPLQLAEAAATGQDSALNPRAAVAFFGAGAGAAGSCCS